MEEFLLTFYNKTYIVILYTIILLIIAIVKFRKNTLEKPIFNCVNLFIMFYYVFIALGPIYLVLVKDYVYNYNIFFIFLLGIICFILGADFVVGNRKIGKQNNNEAKNKTINYESVRINARILLIVSYICVIIYLTQNMSFILQDFENNRVLAMQGSGVIIHLGYMMLPTTWILYYCHLNYKRDKSIYGVFILDILFLLCVGFRSRIMELLLVAIIIKNDNKRFKINKLVIYGVALIVAVSLLQIIRTYISSGTFDLGLDSIAITMSVSSINLKYIFNAFPMLVPYQHGYTYLLSFLMLLPNSSMDATLWLKQVIGIEFSGRRNYTFYNRRVRH